jgi:hypothetical protein
MIINLRLLSPFLYDFYTLALTSTNGLSSTVAAVQFTPLPHKIRNAKIC